MAFSGPPLKKRSPAVADVPQIGQTRARLPVGEPPPAPLRGGRPQDGRQMRPQKPSRRDLRLLERPSPPGEENQHPKSAGPTRQGNPEKGLHPQVGLFGREDEGFGVLFPALGQGQGLSVADHPSGEALLQADDEVPACGHGFAG